MRRRDLLALIGSGIAVVLAPRLAKAGPSLGTWTEPFKGQPEKGDEVWHIGLDTMQGWIDWKGPARDLWEAVRKARDLVESITGDRGGQVHIAYVEETF